MYRVTACLCIAWAALFAGCFVNPTYDGESVRCAEDLDCEHLAGPFVCDGAAGLCIRDGSGNGGGCEDASDCAEGETCSDGVCVALPCGGCPLGLHCNEETDVCEPGAPVVVIGSPDPDAWWRDDLPAEGFVYWTGSGALEVECVHDPSGDESTARAELGDAGAWEEGVVATPWSCALDLEGRREGRRKLQARAVQAYDEGSQSGMAEIYVNRDVTPPVVSDVRVLLEHGGGIAYRPQAVTVEVDARDQMGEDDGLIESVAMRLLAPSGDVPVTGGCSLVNAPTTTCTITFWLDPDHSAAWEVEAGEYTVEATAFDTAGNPVDPAPAGPSVGTATFQVDRTPPEVQLWVSEADVPFEDLDDGATEVTVRRHERLAIHVTVDRPENVASDPRLRAFGARAGPLGECNVPMTLSPLLEAVADDRWSATVDASEACLRGAERFYPLVAVVDEVWTHVPSQPRIPLAGDCDPDFGAVSPATGCARAGITRHLWGAPIPLCAGLSRCEPLPPAVAPDGRVLVAVNYVVEPVSTHRLVTVDPHLPQPTEIWTPPVEATMTDLNLHLSDGPVVDQVGGHRQAYLWYENGFVQAVQQGRHLWGYPESGLEDLLTGGGPVVGSPAVDSNGYVYVPIRLPDTGGAIAVRRPQDGASVRPNIGMTTDLATPVHAGLVGTADGIWLGLFDPHGNGGRVGCVRDDTAWRCDRDRIWVSGTRVGGLAAAPEAYLAGFATADGADIRAHPWGDGPPEILVATYSTPEIVAGPVVATGRLYVITVDGLLVQPRITDDGQDPTLPVLPLPTPLPEGPLGLSVGDDGSVYVLYREDMLEARDEHGSEVLWSVRGLGTLAPRAGLTLARLPQVGGASPNREVGVAYLVADDALHAILTDDGGPAPGWPNQRGGQGRTGAWTGGVDEGILPVDE